MSARIDNVLFSQTSADGSTRYEVAHIQCDTAADLPGVNDFAGITLIQGSEAHDIDQNADYMMQSNGTWILQQAGTAAYTKAEVDNLLLQKEDLLTFDAAPTSGSTNPVYSGGVFTALADKVSLLDMLGTGVNLSGTALNHLDFLGTPDGQGGYTPGRATTPGVYNIGLTTMQNYSDNAPRTDAAAKLIVMYLNSVNNVLLIFLPLVGSIPIYIRQIRYASENYGSWYLLQGTQV